MIVNRAQSDRFVTPNAEVFRMATPALGSRELSVIHQRMQPQGSNPAHRHDREEVLCVLAGEVEVTEDGAGQSLVAGDTCIVPADCLHAIRVLGPDPAEWLIISTSGVQFIGEDGSSMEPDWAK